jgi:hypothetical protein
MPYIDPQERRKYRKQIDALIKQWEKSLYKDGDLNFIISCLLGAAFDANPRYTTINSLVGVLECAKMEFYRRKAASYEDQKIAENGDIWR